MAVNANYVRSRVHIVFPTVTFSLVVNQFTEINNFPTVAATVCTS